MRGARRSLLGIEAYGGVVFTNTIARYLFAVVMVASAFAIKIWLIPFTGTGVPFVLFFGAVLVTILFAGVGPGISAVLLSLPLAVYMFVARAGYPLHQAAFQALLFAIDGTVVVYLTFLMKKRRDQIARSMTRTREIIELAPDAFFQADLAARFTDVNQAACRLLGYDRDELIGRTIIDIIPSEDIPRLFATRDYLRSPGTAEVSEWTLLRKDGTRVPVEVSANILPDGRWQAFVRDINERKRIDWALQESEERFRLTIEDAPVGIALVALDGHFVRVNRAYCEIVGYTSDELTGLTFQAITHPDDVDTDRAAIGQLIRGEIPRYQREKRYLSKDRTIVDVMLSVSVLRDRDGAPRYFISQIEDIGDRKRTDSALKESEQRLNLALDAGRVGMWDLDLITDTSVRSLRHDQIFGYPAPVPVWGAAIFMKHVLPEDRDVARRAFDEAFASGNFELECRIRWADASIHWILARGRVFRSPKGDPLRMMGTVADVTERKRIEEELKAANASLDAIVENVPLMLFIKDSTSLRFLRFNRVGEELLGWPRETITGKSDYDLWPRSQAEFFVKKDRETLKSGKIVDIPEEEIQTRYRGVRILHTKKVPIRDSGGHPICLLGISEDITERSRIEKEQRFLAEANVALSASLDYEQTLALVTRLAVQHVADWCAVDLIDEHKRLRRVSLACADPAKAPVRAVLERTPPSHNLPDLAWSVMEGGRPIIVEHVTPEFFESIAQGPEHLQALRATGVTSAMGVPLEMRGQTLGVLMFGSSTPSRVYGQEDLRLARALADRAAVAIENARLYRESVNATELRDHVLGIVAHDLRNPLSVILLQVDALKRPGPEPERRYQKPREVIHDAAHRMSRLIQDLLDVALMESGQLTIQPARLSARELIAGAVDVQRPLASSSSLELRLDVDHDVPEVWGDRDRLLQVFENLIGNAIKFTEPGGSVVVGATSRDRDVVFRVADTGSGIAPDDVPRVFDRFWQATRPGRQGAGLGLPIAKGIVEAHGGRMWVESTPGEGTTLSFTIPKAIAEQDGTPDRMLVSSR
jgi:PAS domain S-box-containing protein